MAQSNKISFVVWPDGKVDERSLSIFSEGHARANFVRSYLPSDYFGDVNEYLTERIWQGCHQKGFKSHTIEIGEDGKPVLVK